MKITAQQSEGLARSYTIVVAADEVDRQLQTQLQQLGKKAKIPGFRPGKIPMKVLKQRYGKEVMDEVLWNSVNNATRKLVEEEKVRPAMKPDVDIKSYDEGGDLEFSVVFEAMPDVPELDYDKITISEYTFDVPESELNESLDRLAQRSAHLHDAKEGTKAKLGDVVKIDFLGKKDGVPFDGGKGENFQLELGSGQFIPGFEDQLIGVKAGDETTVKVTFPETYHAADLAGVKAEFDVTVHSVHHKHAPHVDDEFAKEIGFDSLDKLKDAVREQIGSDYADMARAKAKKELFDWLDEHVPFDVPAKMKELEFGSVWQQLQQAKADGDPSLDKPEEELRAEYTRISERRVRLGIILSEIGRLNNITVGKEELSRAVMSQAQMFPGQEQKVFEFYRQHPEHVDELRGPIIEDKAVDFILGKVKRQKKPISIEELMDNGEEGTGEDKPAKKKPAAKKKSAAEKDDGTGENKPAAKKKAPAKKKKAE